MLLDIRIRGHYSSYLNNFIIISNESLFDKLNFDFLFVFLVLFYFVFLVLIQTDSFLKLIDSLINIF